MENKKETYFLAGDTVATIYIGVKYFLNDMEPPLSRKSADWQRKSI